MNADIRRVSFFFAASLMCAGQVTRSKGQNDLFLIEASQRSVAVDNAQSRETVAPGGRLIVETEREHFTVLDLNTQVAVSKISGGFMGWLGPRALLVAVPPLKLIVVNAITGAQTSEFLTLSDDVAGVSVVKDQVVVLLSDGRMRVYSARSARLSREIRAFAKELWSSVVSTGGEVIGVIGSPEGIRIFRTSDWKLLGSVPPSQRFKDEVVPLAISARGRYLAIQERGSRSITLFDVESGYESLISIPISDYSSQWLRFRSTPSGGELLDVGGMTFGVPELTLISSKAIVPKDRSSLFFNPTSCWYVDMRLSDVHNTCLSVGRSAGLDFTRNEIADAAPTIIGHDESLSSLARTKERFARRENGKPINLRSFGGRFYVHRLDTGDELAIIETGLNQITDITHLKGDRAAVTDGNYIEIWDWLNNVRASRSEIGRVDSLSGARASDWLFWRSENKVFRQLSGRLDQPAEEFCQEAQSSSWPMIVNPTGSTVTVFGKSSSFTLCSEGKRPHTGQIESFMSSSNFDGERFYYVSDTNGWLRAYDLLKKDEQGKAALAFSIRSNPNGDWFAYTPSGFWEGSSAEAQVYWKLAYVDRSGQPNYDIVEFRQFRGRYRSGLIRSLLSGQEPEGERLTFGPRPKVELLVVSSMSRPMAKVTVEDSTGGIGTIYLSVNGAVQAKREAKDCRVIRPSVCTVEFDLSTVAVGRILTGKNVVAVFATEQSEQVFTVPVSAPWIVTGAPRLGATSNPNAVTHNAPPERKVFALFVGTGKYRNNASLNLPLPERDADALGQAVEAAAVKLVGSKERVRVRVLTTARTAEKEQPTKRNVLAAIEEASKWLTGEDVFLLYLSGHGISVKAENEKVRRTIYYYPTMEASNFEKSAESFKNVSISSDELHGWLKDLPQKQVLIVDTCQSGSAANPLVGSLRAASDDQREALEDLKNGIGLFAIMASSADRLAYESAVFGHGLLTYSLLLALKTRELGTNGRIDVMKWFEASRAEVPNLAAKIQSTQMPEITGRGRPFPIGVTTPELRSNIQLNSAGVFLSIPRVMSRPTDRDFEAELKVQLRKLVSSNRGPQKSQIEYFDVELTSKDSVQPYVWLHTQGPRFGATVQLTDSWTVTPEVKSARQYATREEIAQEAARLIVELAAKHSSEFLKGRDSSSKPVAVTKP